VSVSEEELTRVRQSLDDIRQLMQQFAGQLRSGSSTTGEAPAADPTSRAAGEKAGKTFSDAFSDALKPASNPEIGRDLARVVSSGGQGLGSFATSAAGSLAGGGLFGAAVGSALEFGLEAASAYTSRRNRAIESAPLFADGSFVDRAGSFGGKIGTLDFLDSKFGMFTDYFAKEKRGLREQQEREQAPVIAGASSVADFARQIAEQGGQVDISAVTELGRWEIARRIRGENVREDVIRRLTRDQPTDPSANSQLAWR
jgi:hypothetical protein